MTWAAPVGPPDADERGGRSITASSGTGDIQAVQRVGRLMALFTLERPRLSVAEAAALVGLNRSTVSRYFGSLVLAGVLERSREEQSAYEPGKLLVQLGAVAHGRRRVLDLAPLHMRRLSRETGLTVVLSVLGASGPVVTLVSEIGTSPILATVRVGAMLEMDSAQGHLFLRHSSDTEAVARYWEAVAPEDRARVEHAVAAAGRTGLSTAPTPLGLEVVAAPVFDDHEIAATIGAVGVAAGDVGTPAALHRAAYRISVELGGAAVWRDHCRVPDGD